LKDSYFNVRDSEENIATSEIPNTRRDMTAMHEWEPGDTLYGTHANDSVWLKGYKRDIESKLGKEDDDYKILLIDTLKPILPQIEKITGKRKKTRR